MGAGRGERTRRARTRGGEGRGTGLTFLGRLHGAAGGRRGPQSFSAPADCGRRAEWKLGRDWKAGTWHPRGGGDSGEQQEEEREQARRATPGRLPSGTSSSPTRAGQGSAPRAVGRWHAGGVRAGQACLRPGTRRGVGGVCRAREPVPGRWDPRGDSVAQLGASRSHSDAGPGSAFSLFKAGKHLPRLPPARPLPRPLPAVTSRPCPPESARGPGDKSPSAALPPRSVTTVHWANGAPWFGQGYPGVGQPGRTGREGTQQGVMRTEGTGWGSQRCSGAPGGGQRCIRGKKEARREVRED